MNTELISVPFYRDIIYMVIRHGEPFIPLRPLVINMGLDWRPQFRKVVNYKERWTIYNLTTVAADGKQRKMVCMPLSKLPAFLFSIEPRKVKPELRTKIEKYQTECDKVLWEYWQKGCVINPRSLQIEASLTKLIPLSEYVDLLECKAAYLDSIARGRSSLTIHKLGTEALIAKIRELRERRYSYRQIAKMLGIPFQRAHQWDKYGK